MYVCSVAHTNSQNEKSLKSFYIMVSFAHQCSELLHLCQCQYTCTVYIDDEMVWCEFEKACMASETQRKYGCCERICVVLLCILYTYTLRAYHIAQILTLYIRRARLRLWTYFRLNKNSDARMSHTHTHAHIEHHTE